MKGIRMSQEENVKKASLACQDAVEACLHFMCSLPAGSLERQEVHRLGHVIFGIMYDLKGIEDARPQPASAPPAQDDRGEDHGGDDEVAVEQCSVHDGNHPRKL